jgi:hypothetical protein
METNFSSTNTFSHWSRTSIPLFGSGSEEALEIANRVTKYIHDRFGEL